MSKTKIGVFGALLFGVMILLIPATSIASAQEYEDRYGKVNDVYYEDDRYYYEDDNDEYVYEEYYYPKNKNEKEPPMLLVKKDVLYCDVLANGTDTNCGFNPIPGPDSERYVQECTADIFLCNNITEDSFKMIVTDDVEFPSSEDGTKLNFNGERYTVTEEQNIGNIVQDNANSVCQESGFDSGFTVIFSDNLYLICVLNEGECSGIIQDGELNECTIKNYLTAVSPD